MRAHARLEVDDAIGSADDGVEDDADVTPDDEVGPERVASRDRRSDRRVGMALDHRAEAVVEVGVLVAVEVPYA